MGCLKLTYEKSSPLKVVHSSENEENRQKSVLWNNPIRFTDPDGLAPEDCCDGYGTVADDQVMSLIALQFRAAMKNISSTIVGYARAGNSPVILRRNYTVATDDSGVPFIHESNLQVQSKPAALLFGLIDGASLIPGNVTGVMAKNGLGPILGSTAKQTLLKSKTSFEKLIKEHQGKIDDFLKDPIGNTDPSKLKEMTKDNPTDGVLMERVMGRVKALEGQLSKQQGELKKVNEQLKNLEE